MKNCKKINVRIGLNHYSNLIDAVIRTKQSKSVIIRDLLENLNSNHNTPQKQKRND